MACGMVASHLTARRLAPADPAHPRLLKSMSAIEHLADNTGAEGFFGKKGTTGTRDLSEVTVPLLAALA